MDSIQKQGKHTETTTQAPQTDPLVLWNGWSGPVEIAGMRFEVQKMKMPDDRPVPVVRVIDAPPGTALHGLGGSEVYVTLAQLHFLEFQSRLREGSSKWLDQKRIWDFLHGVFVEAGVKMKLQVKPTASSAPIQPKLEVSASARDLRFGILGVYCFDEQAPRAFFRVRETRSRRTKLLVVELASVERGHPLYDHCCVGTYLFLDTLAEHPIPDFKGSRAGDCYKMWEFLTGIPSDRHIRHISPAARQSGSTPATVPYHGNA